MYPDFVVMYQKLLSQSGFSMERLASFCAVADAGSIVGVAPRDLGRQSLISRQIRELESFFGVELVRRKGRGLEVTETGRELAAVGREGFKGLSDFAARCECAPWSVRIVASNSISNWLLLPMLKRVADKMPDVRFEIFHEQTRDMIRMTREGTYDIAFVDQESLDDRFGKLPLGKVGFSLVLPKGLVSRVPPDLATALSKAPLALPLGGRLRSRIDEIADQAGVTLQVSVGCSSYLQGSQLAESGMCAAALPDLALASLDKKRFHLFPLPYCYELALAWNARNADTRPALARLIGELGEAAVVTV